MQNRARAHSAVSVHPNHVDPDGLCRTTQRVTPLFRPEVLQRHDESGLGETIDIVPLSHLAFASFSLFIILIAAIYAALAGYARKETVRE